MQKLITLSSSRREERIDITEEVRAAVRESGTAGVVRVVRAGRDGGDDDSGKL